MTRSNREETHVVRRALPEDLERVLANLPRTSDRTKEWVRQYFIHGRSTVEIAAENKVAPQHVGSKVRAVRAKLIEQASPMTYFTVTLSLPLALGQELQGLASDLEARASTDLDAVALQPVLRAVAAARKKLAEGL